MTGSDKKSIRISFVCLLTIFLLLSPCITLAGQISSKTSSSDYYFIEFSDCPTQKMKEEITNIGGVLHQYYHKNKYLVEINKNILDFVKALPFIMKIEQYQPIHKINTNLNARSGKINLNVILFDGIDINNTISKLKKVGSEINRVQTEVTPLIICTIDASNISKIAQIKEVMWIEEYCNPVSFMNQITSDIYMGHDTPQIGGFTGSTILAEVQDDGCQRVHPDLNIQWTDGTISVEAHGTSTTGIMLSSGAGNINAQGILYGSTGAFANWTIGRGPSIANLWNGNFNEGNVGMNGVLQSNSWGTDATQNGQYTTYANQIDTASNTYPYVLTTWAMGNGNDGTGEGQHTQDSAAKNIISVGGVWHNDTAILDDDEWRDEGIGNTPSRGPTADNRQKPDLTGPFDMILTTTVGGYRLDFGGTSGATPVVAGSAGLIYDMYIQDYFGNNPSNDLPHSTTVKAMLISDAYQYPLSQATRTAQGWGTPDLECTYDLGASYHVIEDYPQALDSGDSWNRNAYIDGTHPLKISLTWNDPTAPASTGTGRALINNLDLKVTAPDSTIYWGNNGLFNNLWSTSGTGLNHWTLNTDHKDDLNNVENVFVQSPQTGYWTFEVVGRTGDLPNSPQHFSLVASGAMENEPPPIFSGLESITDPGLGNALDLHWTAATDNEGSYPITYNIYRSTTSGGQNFAISTATYTPSANPGDPITHQDTELSLGVEYFYVVRAEDSLGNEESNIIEMSGTPGDSIIPNFIGIESITDPGLGYALDLHWTAATDNEGSYPITYNIYRSTISGGQNFGVPTASYTPTANPGDPITYQDTGLTYKTTYYYVVRAQDSQGNEDTNTVELSGVPNRKPIRINSNADFNIEHGVVGGLGVKGNPWIIEGWDIDGTGYGYCIYIGNTTDYFTIKSCDLHHTSNIGVSEWKYWSLILSNVKNGTIYNNNISDNPAGGILLSQSSQINVSNNQITEFDEEIGIGLDTSVNNIICNNVISTLNGYGSYGIYITDSSHNNLINNNSISLDDNDYISWSPANGGFGCGVYCLHSNYNKFTYNTFTETCMYALRFWNASFTDISNNTIVDTLMGGICILHSDIFNQKCEGNIISNNSFTNCSYAYFSDPAFADRVIVAYASNNTIKNNSISNSYGTGIEIGGNNCTVELNNIWNISCGNSIGVNVLRISGENHTINNNNISNNVVSNAYSGASLRAIEIYPPIDTIESNNVTISRNSISNSGHGIFIHPFTNNSLIIDNTITCSNSFTGGILIQPNSNGNLVQNNTINLNNFDWTRGIYSRSSNNTFTQNNIFNSMTGIRCYGNINYNLFSNNTIVNVNQGIFLEDDWRNIVINNTIINCIDQSLVFHNSRELEVKDNYINNSGHGILILGTSNVSIYNNIFLNSIENGVYIYGLINMKTKDNFIYNNKIAHNHDGIYIGGYTNNSKIFNNTITDNYNIGINLNGKNDWSSPSFNTSKNNMIYHNSLNNNSIQARDNTINSNYWDNGYPIGGNYWSDFLGVDGFSGPNQDLPGSDCIGDTPYIFNSNWDNYPLMHPTTGSWVDLNTPKSSINTLSNYWRNSSPVIIYATANDTGGSGVNNVTLWKRYSPDNSTWENWHSLSCDILPPWSWNLTFNEGEGFYEFHSIANDSHGNSEPMKNYAEAGCCYDITAPLVDAGTNATINVNYTQNSTVLDITSGISIYQWTMVSGPSTVTFTPNNVEDPQISADSDGVYICRLIVLDKAGNTAFDDFELTWDSTKPIITLISPQNNSVIVDGTLLNFNVSDIHLNHVSYSINGEAHMDFTGDYDIDTTGWNDDTYNITIHANDTGNNKITKVFTFIIDSTPPNITLNSPENGSVIPPGTIINFTVLDDHLDTVSNSINGDIYYTLDSPYNINTTGWLDGVYNIAVYANDSVDNNVTSTFTFIIDSINPEISLLSPSNNSIILPGTLIQLSVTDYNLDVLNFAINRGSYQILNSPFDIDTTTWDDGPYILDVYATDDANNNATATYNFIIDGTAPTIISTTPENNSMSINVSTTIVLEFTEPMNTSSVEKSITYNPVIAILSYNWNPSNSILTIIPASALTKNTTYVVILNTTAKDIAGNSIQHYQWSFTTWVDTDGDGVLDSDGDGFLDEWEEFLGTDPKNPNETPIDTDGDGIPDGDTNNTLPWMDTDDDNDGVQDTEDPAPLDPTITTLEEDDVGGGNYWWILLLLAVIIVAGLLIYIRKKPDVITLHEPELETEDCLKCGFMIEKGSKCPFCEDEKTVEKQSEPPEPKPVQEQKEQKTSMANEEILTRIEKAYKEGKISEVQYQKNLTKFG